MKNKNIKSTVFKIINITIVAGLGFFLVYYLLTQINVNDLKTTFLKIYIPSLLIGLGLMFSVDFFKAYRQIILVGSGSLRFADMFFVSLIRNAFNMVLPARTGEISYVYVLKKKFKIPVEIGVSTLMIGLIFDIIIVFCLIIISIFIVGINRYAISSVTIIIIAIALLAVSLLILFFLPGLINIIIKFLNFLKLRIIKLEKNKIFSLLYDKLLEINKNIKIIQSRKIYWKVYLLSIVTRVLKFTSYYFLIHAALKPLGYDFSDISYWVIFLATVTAEISAVLPTHAIAGFGTYEGVFALAFTMLGFSKEISIIVGFNYHVVNLLFTITWGIIAIIIIALPFYKIKLPDINNSNNKKI